ncbi:DUF4476 domain-containing protein [Stigmatella sp. ncwal1]|uniref:DUF4476 domain-containing protein n=1 Tax=Stigmatella ashevillensis TaxID=2995309 RepID=A0ABT5DLZ6_9BACT|nr:DUF4476 domain-containing protein [Stigmatella ashevillena]MDC0714682.1 DUF4476 domain-containing protein [Stigmatella ashevillena]
MKHILRAALVSSLFASSAVLAQDMNMEMKVHVDENGMPSTQINMQVPDEEGNPQGMRMNSSSTHMEVKVKGDRGAGRRERVEVEEEHQESRRRPPAPEPVYRDCGTQRDPGCSMSRDGQYAMDGETFRGFMKALKSQANEISRQEMTEKMLKRQYLTAIQFGQVLDLFANEISRLEVAKFAAPHVVNPQHALGFSSKWRNSISAEEYTEMISEQ